MSDQSNSHRQTVSTLAATVAAVLLLTVAERSDAGLSDSLDAAEENVNIIADAVTTVIIDPALEILDESLSPTADARSIQGQAREYFGRAKRKFNEAASQVIHNNMKAAANMFGFGEVRGFRAKFQASVVDHVAGFVESKAWETAASITDRLASGAKEGERRADSPPRRNSIVDMRIALAIDKDERRWYEAEARVLGKARLPAVTVSRTPRAPDPYPRSLAEAWGMDAETIRRSRDPATWAPKPDPWGQDAGQGWDSPPAAPAATKVDVWSADAEESEHGRSSGATVATADPWGQDSEQGWASAPTTPVVGDVGTDPIDAQWQNEYAAALNHFLGLDDEDSSYEAALVEVERLELEAVERERLAEQQRLEAQERERQARLEAQKRERQIARMEAELKSARAERRRQANTQAFVRGVQNAVGALQPMLDQTAALVQQDREARLRRDLARLREQARAEQARAATERQQRQAAEQQRRQAAKQERLEQDLRRWVQRCEDIDVLVNECLSISSDYHECLEENRRTIARHVQSCKQRAWDAYNRSGGGTIFGVGRLE